MSDSLRYSQEKVTYKRHENKWFLKQTLPQPNAFSPTLSAQTPNPFLLLSLAPKTAQEGNLQSLTAPALTHPKCFAVHLDGFSSAVKSSSTAPQLASPADHLSHGTVRSPHLLSSSYSKKLLLPNVPGLVDRTRFCRCLFSSWKFCDKEDHICFTCTLGIMPSTW